MESTLTEEKRAEETAPAKDGSRGLFRLSREQSVGLNRVETEKRRQVLTAPPRLVTLGAHNSCNAKCVFCLEGKYQRFDLGLYKTFFEGKMGHFIRQAQKVTFTGFGEVLWLPDILETLDYLNETIPETEKIFTTNGTPLRPAVLERLVKSRYVIQISLHASNAKLHEDLTQLPGAFPQIIENIRELSRLRRELRLQSRLHIVVSDVITRANVDDLPSLLQLVWDLRVPELQCHYVTMYNADHIDMSCYFDQARANAAIDAGERKLAEIRASVPPEVSRYFRVQFPPRFGESRSGEPNQGFCADPWEHIYVEAQGSVLPCCYWGVHVGNLNKGDEIDDVWNSSFYRTLRSGISSGTPHPWCANCFKYRGYNVDNLLCHVTNRPDQQKNLLREIEKRGLMDVSAYWPQVEAAEKFVPRAEAISSSARGTEPPPRLVPTETSG